MMDPAPSRSLVMSSEKTESNLWRTVVVCSLTEFRCGGSGSFETCTKKVKLSWRILKKRGFEDQL